MAKRFRPKYDFESIEQHEWDRRKKILATIEPDVEMRDILYGPLSVSFPVRIKEEITKEAQSRGIPISWVVVEWALIGRDMQIINDNYE